MSLDDHSTAAKILVDRVKAILTRPGPTWTTIEGEASPIGELYRYYVIPLAAIAPVCSMIGNLAFGRAAPGFSLAGGVVSQAGWALVTWMLGLVGVYIFALIVDWLAPHFGGVPSREQAFKLGAYSSTAGWVAGVFLLFPPLSFLTLIAGLYGLYLMYLGLPKLMVVSKDKAVIYTVCAVLAAIVVSLVVSLVAGLLLAPVSLLARLLS